MALRVRLADQLALVELYTILSPLEHIYRRPRARRSGSRSSKALSRFLYKRTFITLREALGRPDPILVDQAARALEELRFPHAFDPLARIYRESQSVEVRRRRSARSRRSTPMRPRRCSSGSSSTTGPQERSAAVEALKRARGASSSTSRASSSAPRRPRRRPRSARSSR